MLGSYQNRTGSTSVASSLECAIANSRLSSLIAPSSDSPPAGSSMAKKRRIKPCFRDGSSSKKGRVTFKLDDEKKDSENSRERIPVKTKAELKYMGDDNSGVSQNFIPPILRPPMYPTHTVVKNSSSGYFGQKRYKKMSVAAQMKRSKEGQVDLVSPDSILSKINGRTLFNFETFNLLPKLYQYHLVKLLPQIDQETDEKGELKPTNTAFSNEFFTSAFDSWKERLSEGEFTQEMNQKIQLEQDRKFNQDPWKIKHFESVWGEKLQESTRYTSPVVRSHHIMEQVRIEWDKEQELIAKEKEEKERLAEEKEKESKESRENTDLSAPNKIQKNATGKNGPSKQNAALVRQQKLAKAKSVSNKALKDTKSLKGTAKSVAKNGTEQNGKGKSRPKAKQTKGKSEINANDESSEATSEETTSLVENDKSLADTEPIPPSLSEASDVSEPTPTTFLDTGQRTTAKEKPNKKSSNSKKKKDEPSKTINSTHALNLPCLCILKPMVKCLRCGAFCHSDCINPMSLCTVCAA